MHRLSHAAFNLLACPVCKGPLLLAVEAGVEAVACQGCGRRYPLIDGIPVLIPERASAAPSRRSDAGNELLSGA